jgi:hypothetical protein
VSEGKWFIAVLVVASEVVRPSDEEPLVDLQYKLIRANDSEAAFRRALQLGEGAHHSYRNGDGSTVTWRFAGLHDLREVEQEAIVDGAELYNHMMHSDPTTLTVAKDKLTVFWSEANKHRTARDILGE